MLNKNFYPTPKDVAQKMWRKIKRDYIANVLEPSAGKGDLLDVVKNSYDRYDRTPKMYAIEIEPELRSILEAKEYTVLDDDFLQFETYTPIDTIIMNPPFDEGDKHLLKALEVIKNGGQVVCLLNEETLLNPYTNDRKRLATELENLKAEIEYIGDAFSKAERKTNVRCAIVYVNISRNPLNSEMFKDTVFDVAEEMKLSEEKIGKDVAVFDELMQLVKDYKTEIELIKKAHEAINAANYFAVVRKAKDEYLSSFEVVIGSGGRSDFKSQLTNIRHKYWSRAINLKMFSKYLTSATQSKVLETVNAQSEIEFNIKNIMLVKQALMQFFVTNIEQAAIGVFNDITGYHQNEYSKNIHYYNGWKTNKASRINKRIILPFYGYSGGVVILELEKVLNYFDTFNDIYKLPIPNYSSYQPQQEYQERAYFTVQTYKKGTMHITFTRLDLLDRFNLFIGQKNNWIPDKEERNHKERTAIKKEIFQHYEPTDEVNAEINTSGVLLLCS